MNIRNLTLAEWNTFIAGGGVLTAGEGVFIYDTGELRIGVGSATTTGGSAGFTDGSGAATLSSLSDTTIGSLSAGEGLVWNGSTWSNQTFNVSGVIDGLDDVDTTTSAPTVGQVLEWDGTNWVPGNSGGGGGSTTLAALTDVTITAAANGDYLRHNGTAWVDSAGIPRADLEAGTAANQILEWDGSAWQLISTPSGGGGSTTLGGLTDVTITAAADGEVLRHNGTAWVDSVLSVDDLSNVDISTSAPAVADYLAWDGSNFVPTAPSGGASSLAALSDVTVTAAADGDFLIHNGTAWVDEAPSVDRLADVDTSTSAPAVSDYLAWDGTNWVPTSPSGGASSLSALSDVTITATADGDYLRHNGTDWVDAVPSLDDMSQVDISTVAPSGALNGLAWDGSNFVPTALTDELPDLADVSLTSLAANQALVYDGSNWVNEDSLPVNITSPSEGEVLTYDATNSEWVNNTSLSFQPGAVLPLSNGDVLQYQVSGNRWVNAPAPSGDSIYTADGTIGGTRDIACGANAITWQNGNNFTWVTNGDSTSGTSEHQLVNLRDSGLLIWQRASSTQRMGLRVADTSIGIGSQESTIFKVASRQHTDFATGLTTLQAQASIPVPLMPEAERDLITAPAQGHQVYNTDTNTIDYYDGTQWNQISASASFQTSQQNQTGTPPIGVPADGQILVWDTDTWVNRLPVVDDMSDVDTTTTAPVTGDALEFDGTNWVPAHRVANYRVDIADAGAAWGTAGGGFYTITIPKPANITAGDPITVQVFEDQAGTHVLTQVDTLAVNQTTGDVTISVTEAPDGRFAGNVVIQG